MGPILKRRREEFRMGIKFELKPLERIMASLMEIGRSGGKGTALLGLCWV